MSEVVPEHLTATDLLPEVAAREAALYCAIAFGFSWLPHFALVLSGRPYPLSASKIAPVPAALYGLGLLGPSAAAFVLEQRRRGRSGLRLLARAAKPGTTTKGRVAAALSAQPALVLVASALGRGLDVKGLDAGTTVGQVWVVSGEEFGWRGFLLPRLRRVMPAVPAIAAMTVIWGGWHLPMFFVAGSPQAKDGFAHFTAAIFAWSAIHHVLQIDRPSVATAMVFHAAANVTNNALVPHRRGWLTAAYIAAGVAATWAAHRREQAQRGSRRSIPETG